MSGASISRSFLFCKYPFSFSSISSSAAAAASSSSSSSSSSLLLARCFSNSAKQQRTLSPVILTCYRLSPRLFSSSVGQSPTATATATPDDVKKTTRLSSTLTNFSLSDSESDSDDDRSKKTKEIDKSKLPPPYDPFNKKKPVIEEPKDPKNLQEVFHNMRSDGLMQNAVKMFDALSKDGLTHEALELFGQIKDKGKMPDVIAHTAVIETYANAGQSKEALKVYLGMLASGVMPNAYTYAVLIKGLAANAKFLGDAKKYLLEMIGKGMRPNAGTYTAVFEAFAREQKEDEARELVEQMKAKGFVPNEKDVREAIQDKRGHVFRTVIDILCST